jgi:hypothetical protein
MPLVVTTYLEEYLVTNAPLTVSNIPNFIEIAIQKINKRLRGTFVETVSSSPTLPVDFVAMRYLTVNGIQYNYKLQAEQGTFSIVANTLTLTPALVSGDILNYVYYAINETDLTAVAPAMLIHAAAAEALMFEGNAEGAAQEYALSAALIDDGNGWDTQGTLTMGGIVAAGGISGGSAPPPMLASNVQFTPSGTISATNVQTAIQELDNETQASLALKADKGLIASSGLTQSTGVMLGRTTAGSGSIENISIGTGLSLSAGSLVNTVSVAGLAPIASPAFTGNPTAPTPGQGDNDTSLATTAFAMRIGLKAQANITSISGDITLTATDSGKAYYFNGAAATVTLPLMSSMNTAGGMFAFYSFSGNPLTVTVSGADGIFAFGNGSAASIILNRGDAIILCNSGGASWIEVTSSRSDYAGSTVMAAQNTTSGTIFTFNLPVGVKNFTVFTQGVSGSGTGNLQVQLGDAGGLENTGYVGSVNDTGTLIAYTSGFLLCRGSIASTIHNGKADFALVNSATNTWAMTGTDSNGTPGQAYSCGYKPLSQPITTVNLTWAGADTFDAGLVGLQYSF